MVLQTHTNLDRYDSHVVFQVPGPANNPHLLGCKSIPFKVAMGSTEQMPPQHVGHQFQKLLGDLVKLMS